MTGEESTNSIKPMNSNQEISNFFYEELMPLASKLQEEGKSFFSVKPDSNARTYYVRRAKTTMQPEDFEAAGCNSVDDLKEALVGMWVAQGNPELVVLAGTLSRLAKSLRFAKKQDDEVSPFIYVMF